MVCGRARLSGVKAAKGVDGVFFASVFCTSSAARLVQSEWCVRGSDSSLVCFQTPEKNRKAEMSSPVPVPKNVPLKQTEQEKEHNPWLFEGWMVKCGELKRRVVSCRVWTSSLARSPCLPGLRPPFPWCLVQLSANRPTSDDANQSDAIQESKNARVP